MAIRQSRSNKMAQNKQFNYKLSAEIPTYQAIGSTAVFFSRYISHVSKYNTECDGEDS